MATTPPDLDADPRAGLQGPAPEGVLRPLPRARAHARPRLGLRGRPDGHVAVRVDVLPRARDRRGEGARPRPGDPRAEPLLVHGPLLRRRVHPPARAASWRSRSCSCRRCSGSTRTAACSRCGAATRTRRRSSPRTGSSSAAARSSCTARAAARARATLSEQPKRGIGRLALESGAPVVPVAIHGSSHVRNWKRAQFPKVRVRYGDAIRWAAGRGPDARPAAGRGERDLRARSRRCTRRWTAERGGDVARARARRRPRRRAGPCSRGCAASASCGGRGGARARGRGSGRRRSRRRGGGTASRSRRCSGRSRWFVERVAAGRRSTPP